MGHAKVKPLYNPATDIEDDLYLWCYEQAELLRHRRFGELDLPNLIEELESMARKDKHALTSAYRVLLQHLLKWQFQPQLRGSSWEITIRAQRREIETLEEQNPSLAAKVEDLLLSAYAKARQDAIAETRLPQSLFPESRPYTIGDIRNLDWLPD